MMLQWNSRVTSAAAVAAPWPDVSCMLILIEGMASAAS